MSAASGSTQPPVRSYIHISEPIARAILRDTTPSLVRMGIMNGITCTRCGAFLRSRWRSRSASYTSRGSSFR